MNEGILVRDSREWKKLEWIAASLELESKHNAEYKVANVYLDLGAGWMWTTIVRHGYRECQILNPREWHMIMDAESLADLIKAVDFIRHGEYFGD